MDDVLSEDERGAKAEGEHPHPRRQCMCAVMAEILVGSWMNKWSAWSDTRRPGTVEVERGFEGTGKKDDESDRSDEGRRRRTWTMRPEVREQVIGRWSLETDREWESIFHTEALRKLI